MFYVRIWILLCLLSAGIAGQVTAQGIPLRQDAHASAADPSGSFMIRQLTTMSDRYWARVAGRDGGLPPHANGHDEFAHAWTGDVLRELHGLPVGVVHQRFATPGFVNLPAAYPGDNVMVVVPGATYPNEAIVVGTHYDGEPTSFGSTYDDTSGCVILLALAHLLGDRWRSHGPPARTVEFVLFDAEEQGLIGSAAYRFAYLHRAVMPKPIFMINEEQSGVGYPVRPFGLPNVDPAPSFADTTGQFPKPLERIFGQPESPDTRALNLALHRLHTARSQVFLTLHALYPSLPYRDGHATTFSGADQHYLRTGPMDLCCSDNGAFEALGLPTVTFSGDTQFYTSHHESWAFPFDQPQDTVQSLSCDTGGSPRPGLTLQAALDLPLYLSVELVNSYAPSGKGSNATVFSTVPETGKSILFQAVGMRDARWEFGDHGTATGTNVHHLYRHAGTYHLTLHSRSKTIHQVILVPRHQSVFRSTLGVLHPPRVTRWSPQELQSIPGCNQ